MFGNLAESARIITPTSQVLPAAVVSGGLGLKAPARSGVLRKEEREGRWIRVIMKGIRSLRVNRGYTDASIRGNPEHGWRQPRIRRKTLDIRKAASQNLVSITQP